MFMCIQSTATATTMTTTTTATTTTKQQRKGDASLFARTCFKEAVPVFTHQKNGSLKPGYLCGITLAIENAYVLGARSIKSQDIFHFEN